MFRPIAFAAFIAYASAQSLTSSCTTALTGIATNPDAAACLSPGSLISLAAGGANSSIITPINSWLTSLCSSPACSNDTIAAVVQNVTTGCATDLSGLGFNPSLTPSITSIIQQYYPTVRQVVCLKDGDTNCITQTLTNVQNIVGTLSLTNIIKLASTSPDLPANVTCTNCVKAAYNIVGQNIPSLVSDSAPALQSQCGASFTDGTTPAGILQSASTSAASTGASKAAALGSASMISHGIIAGLGASALVVISSLFTFLA
ncbi:hypothetical protein GALMADRAFT_248455 [Galerina marginata CBS 339.88]|uniref:Uncharacterized protein n=1 Tax=Galerina marginata (strain CBS 339.88) TaxID=685588 RepID=A0A067T761_GALM3|nr:hypothetical protein GALMADRAFT_248455 [Galerina marginata CBS 339.88]